jgi:DinB superfamily
MATRALTLEQILIQLPETPRRLAMFTEDVTPAYLQVRPAPGEWSASEVLAHLRACADVWGNNIVTCNLSAVLVGHYSVQACQAESALER